MLSLDHMLCWLVEQLGVTINTFALQKKAAIFSRRSRITQASCLFFDKLWVELTVFPWNSALLVTSLCATTLSRGKYSLSLRTILKKGHSIEFISSLFFSACSRNPEVKHVFSFSSSKMPTVVDQKGIL